MDLTLVEIENPDDLNLVLGQAHFIKTIDDLHEALAGSSPYLHFGIAFCESSGPRLIRRSGNDGELVELAVRNLRAIGAGHAFLVFLRDGLPVNVLNQLKQVPEVCRIYCATANPVQVVVAETGRAAASSASSTAALRLGSKPTTTWPLAGYCSAASATSPDPCGVRKFDSLEFAA